MTRQKSITLATLSAACAELPPPPQWLYFAVKPEVADVIRNAIPRGAGIAPGIEIHTKANQVANSWGFAESATLHWYLSGTLTELDLIGMVASGACRPFEE